MRCFTAAQPLAVSAGQGGIAYDKAAPLTPAGDRKFFDADLTTFLDTTFAKVQMTSDHGHAAVHCSAIRKHESSVPARKQGQHGLPVC